jgi:tRNA pseudouridine65 synthase
MGNDSEINKKSLLTICYEDDYYIAINKPQGLLVHRSKISQDTDVFAVQELRNQVGYHVFPVHRLDRKTSGVLMFAKKAEYVAPLQTTFQDKSTQKRYLAIVRGFFPNTIEVDHPLTNDNGKTQDAHSIFNCLSQSELPIPFGKFPTSRYSLIEAFPLTGRMHQLRKHLNHLRHPIIGDRPHGCNKQNKLFLEKWGLEEMLLHANNLEFIQPFSKNQIQIEALPPSVFKKFINLLKFNYDSTNQ